MTARALELARGRLAKIAVLVTIAAALVVAAAMPRGLFSGDEGLKLAQTQELIASDFTSAEVHDRGRRYAKHRRANLYTAENPGFVYYEPGTTRIYGTYPLLYPLLAVPPYLIGGPFAVAALSLLGFAIAQALIARLARRCLGSDAAAAAVVLITGLTSPLLFYSSLVFEHTLSVAALLGAITLMVHEPPGHRRAAIAGALFGLATCFRTELLAFAPPMAMVVAWALGVRVRSWTRWLAFGAGAAGVVGLFLLAHHLTTPFWHPTLMVSAQAAPSKLAQRFIQLVPKGQYIPGQIAALVTVVGSVLVLVTGRLRERLRLALTVIATLGWGVLVIDAIGDVDGSKVRTLTGLVTATPLVVLAVVRGINRGDRESPTGVLALAGLVFLATVVLLPKRGSGGGLELGSRYMLPIVPLLVIAAVDHARRRRVYLGCAAALVALGAWATVVNLRCERDVRGLGANIVTAIETAKVDAMLTTNWWVAQLAIPTQGRTALFVSRRPTKVYEDLYDAGVRRVIVLRGGAPPADGRVKVRRIGDTPPADKRLGPSIYELYEPAK